jgi:hypothetical protein
MVKNFKCSKQFVNAVAKQKMVLLSRYLSNQCKSL